LPMLQLQLQPRPGARQPLGGGTYLVVLRNRDWPGAALGDHRPAQRDHAQPHPQTPHRSATAARPGGSNIAPRPSHQQAATRAHPEPSRTADPGPPVEIQKPPPDSPARPRPTTGRPTDHATGSLVTSASRSSLPARSDRPPPSTPTTLSSRGVRAMQSASWPPWCSQPCSAAR
jgi:hypothetical protein